MASVNIGDTVTVAIEKPAVGGAMIARVEGQVVLVSGAIPGERVRVRVARIGKGVAHADTVAVEDASADRRDVSADPSCGGALYAHIAYPRQLRLKSEVVADAFARIARLPLGAAVGVAPSPEEGYRMRARLHARGARLGFFREGTHDLCDPRRTRQLLPATCDALDRVSGLLASARLDGVHEAELAENVDASERVLHLESAAPLDRRLEQRLAAVEGFTPGPYVADALTIEGRSLRLRRHVLAFFQGNRYLLAALVRHVVGQVPRATPLIDLYAGAGLFSIAAAALRGAAVTAVEGDRIAARDLEENAAASGAPVTPVAMAVEDFVRGRDRGSRAPTTIVDPPRTGLSRAALDGVLALEPDRLIYVSCDVATLARDARRIIDGGYAIESIDGFDLFPNTPHVETVVVFARR